MNDRTPPSSGAPARHEEHAAAASNTGATARRARALSWFPAITATSAPVRGEVEQRSIDDLLRTRDDGAAVVEQVTGDDDEVDVPRVRRWPRSRRARRGARRHGCCPGSPCRRASRWCVAASLGQTNPSNGSADDVTAHRVAPRGPPPQTESPTPGTGIRRSSGIGSRGCETYIEPGLRIVARWRCADGSHPYCSRPASAESSRPTTRIA